MAATTVIHSGQADGSGSEAANWLVKANDMLLTEFDDTRIMAPRVRRVPVAPGQVAVQIPLTGSIKGSYHTPGQNIIEDGSYLQDLLAGKITIAADRKLLAGPVMIDDLDQFLNYWDIASVTLREMGRFLANVEDRMLLKMLTKGAVTAADRAYTGEPGGQEVIVTGSHSSLATITGANLIDAVYEMAEKFFEDNVPMDEGTLHIALPPSEYYKLIKESAAAGLVIDVDLNAGAANGSVAAGYVKMVGGFMVHKTNHIPAEATAADTDSDGLGLNDAYATIGDHRINGATGDRVNVYSNDTEHIVGLAWQENALGVAEFQAPSFEMERKIEYQGTVAVGRRVCGAEVLRPSCCGIFRWAAAT